MPGDRSYNKALLLKIAGGDETAFRELFNQYNKRLYSFVEQLTKSGADAEEIVQESFLKLWVNRASLPGIDHPGNYIYTIARNKTLDHIRKVSRDQKLLDQLWVNMSHADHSMEEELRTQEYRQLIDQALAQLPGQKQVVFRLSREQGLSHEAIAGRLGLSKSRVNNILVETMKFIRQYLEQHAVLLAIAFWIDSGNCFF